MRLRSRQLLSLYLIGVGLAIISVWVIFSVINFIPSLKMGTKTLITHIIAEIIVGLQAIIAGILVLTKKRFAVEFVFLSEGALLYAILNILGYYWDIKLTWLVAILTPTLIFHLVVIIISFKVMRN